MKSQDQIEDSKESPERSKDQSGFSLFWVFFSQDSPCDCNLFYRVESGSKHERKSYAYFNNASILIKGYDINKYET